MMNRYLPLSLFCLLVATGLSAIDITSIAAGGYDDPATWDCACVPSAVDDVFVLHDVDVSVVSTGRDVVIFPGAKLSTSEDLDLMGDLIIQNGAEMDNDGILGVSGAYVLNGVHSGTGKFRMFGSTIAGIGIMANTKDLELRGPNKTILAPCVLDFSSIKVRMYSNVRLTNLGDVKFRLMFATGNNWIINGADATVEFTFTIPAFKLLTSAAGNKVIYGGPPTVNHRISQTISGYERLVVRGSLTGVSRRLGADITVNGELRIETTKLDVSSGTMTFDITMNGDWVNASGEFVPQDGLVNFSGRGNVIKHFNDKETFGRVEFSGNTILNSDIEVTGELTLTDSLDQQGRLVQIEGDWAGNGGTLVDESAVVAFTGSSNSFVSGETNFNNVSISKNSGVNVEMTSGFMFVWKSLLLTTGNLVTNDMVKIASGPDGTGRIGRVTFGTVDGDVHIQRYAPFTANGWHNICGPIQGMTLGQWQPDFVTTGFTGSDYPAYDFINITKYDESLDGDKDIGFYDVSDISEIVPDGTGVRAYLAGYSTLLEVKGEIIIGPYDFPIVYTPTSGGALMDGWNLLANPYASNINWDSPTGWSRTDINNAVYVWDYTTQQYASYVDGVGTNGGSAVIPSSQAFWVQSTSNSASLQINEFAKTTDSQTYRSPGQIEHLTIKMRSANGRTDEVAFRFKDDATRDYNSGMDALEMRSTEEDVPSLAFVSEDGMDCSIYSISEMREETVLPLTLKTGVNGPVTFSCDGYSSFSHLGLHILDAATGRQLPLSEDGIVQVRLQAGEYVDRFFLIRHHSSAGPMDALATDTGLGVELGNGQLVITNSDEATSVDLRVYNAHGQLMAEEEGMYVASRATYDLSTLRGLLIIELTDRRTGEVTVEKVSR